MKYDVSKFSAGALVLNGAKGVCRRVRQVLQDEYKVRIVQIAEMSNTSGASRCNKWNALRALANGGSIPSELLLSCCCWKKSAQRSGRG